MKGERAEKTIESIASLLVFEALCHTVFVWFRASGAYTGAVSLHELELSAAKSPNLLFLSLTGAAYLAANCWVSWEQAVKLLFRYRYPLAGAIFVLCVALGISGSSVGMFAPWLGHEDQDLLLGIDRAIRSDEWAVWTPMVASQYADPTGHFSYFSSVLRAAPTDVFLEYGTPVLSWVSVFRPFHLGFLFLPLANGMAFFWAGRQIALLLVSFEFGRMLTEDDRCLSSVYALFVAFSPVVEWWFAINGFVEMLIYIQLSILALKRYLRTDALREKLMCAAAAVVCAGGYALTMYPPWMIPLAYLLLALAVWTVVDKRNEIRMGKTDALLVVGAAVVLAAVFGYVYHLSGDTIRTIMGTAYPGARFETGGGFLATMFSTLTNLWTGLMQSWPPSNECENAGFLTLFPLSFLLLVFLARKGKVDSLCGALLAAELFLGFYCVVGFPAPLAKLSLLSHAQAGRAVIAVQLCDWMLLIRELTLLKHLKLRSAGMAGLAVIVMLPCCALIYIQNVSFFPAALVLVTGIVGGALCCLLLFYTQTQRKRLLCLAMAGVVFVSGMIVNPVRHGMDSVKALPELQMIRETVNADTEAVWVVDREGFPFINLPLMAGARTINSTNVYPALERWRQLDPAGAYDEVYNRYAHITIEVTENVPLGEQFTLMSPDQFKVLLTPEELRSLGVSYVLSNRELNEVQFQMLAEEGAQRVYRLKDIDLG